jgi:hypothetical protein
MTMAMEYLLKELDDGLSSFLQEHSQGLLLRFGGDVAKEIRGGKTGGYVVLTHTAPTLKQMLDDKKFPYARSDILEVYEISLEHKIVEGQIVLTPKLKPVNLDEVTYHKIVLTEKGIQMARSNLKPIKLH